MRHPIVLASLALALACLSGWYGAFQFGQTNCAAQVINPSPSLPPEPQPVVPGMLPAPAGPGPGAPFILPSKTPLEAHSGIDLSSETSGTQEGENHSLHLDPAITLEWVGPQSVSLGRNVVFHVVVKNVGSATAEHVVVRHHLPAGVKLLSAEPKPATEGNQLVWDLGTIEQRQEKKLELQLLPDGKGDYACQASVSFTSSSVARFQVREPKLAVKVSSPDKVLVGDAATLNLTVSNSGDGTANHVKVSTTLPEGLQHVRGKNVEFDLGSLAPKETRNLQIVCTTRSPGEHKCEVVVNGDGNLKVHETATVVVVLPHIDVTVAGPRLRYVDRPAAYVIKVTNPSPAAVSDITITEHVPAGFKFISASDGGRHDGAAHTVSWVVGDMTPGQSHEVRVELLPVAVGDHAHKVVAEGSRGIKTEAEISTRVEGLSALVMELADQIDPVEVGVEDSYEIRVSNAGSKTETNVQLICTLPEKMEFRSAQGPGNCKFRVEGKEVIFEVLQKLTPRADAIYKINVRGTAPGDMRFKASLKADGLTEPLHREESTRVYSDEDFTAPGR